MSDWPSEELCRQLWGTSEKLYTEEEVRELLLNQHVKECEVCDGEKHCNMYLDIVKERSAVKSS